MKKRIIVHIGPAKTGTSALQYYLLKNKDKLEEHGFLYPTHPLDENNIWGGHADLDIKQEINSFLKSKYHTLILSSESFWHRVGEINQVHKDIEFVVFYRGGFEREQSAYIQNIKRDFSFEKFDFKKIDDTVNGRIIELVENADLNFSVYPYMFDYESSWSIVNAFLKNIDKKNKLCDLHEKEIQIINPAYSVEALEIKRYINKFVNKGDKKQSKILIQRLDTILQRFVSENADYSFFTDEQYEAHRGKEIKLLKKLINECNQKNLYVFLFHATESKNKLYSKQELSDPQVEKIVKYIAENDIDVLRELFSIIPKNENDFVYTYIREVLCIE